MARNLSINRHYVERGEKHTPRFRFGGKTREDFAKWKVEARAAAVATLGEMPRKVPRNPEILLEWREDGLIKQRVIFDVEEGLSVVGYVFRPEGKTGLPAILACHGHGKFGKDGVMGIGASGARREEISRYNYDYGLQMAKAGFATMAIDWRGFGERDDRREPLMHDVTMGRDQCDVHNIRALLLGHSLLGLDVHDGMCALDYLCAQDFVNAEKIGVMGLSFGGTMATWMSICDARVKATDVICYSDRFGDFGMRNVNLCGSQITPGLYAACDVADLQGLTAPRPLLVEIGIHDSEFLIDSAMGCFREVEKIFTAAGARDRLELDLFEGGHKWGANKSMAFFHRWL